LFNFGGFLFLFYSICVMPISALVAKLAGSLLEKLTHSGCSNWSVMRVRALISLGAVASSVEAARGARGGRDTHARGRVMAESTPVAKLADAL